MLLAASLLFYAWGEGPYAGILLLSIAINYLCGRLIATRGGKHLAKTMLVIGIVCNLALLCGYKYLKFFILSFDALASAIQNAPFSIENLHIPIGISFFTFKAISYLVDVYRNPDMAEKHPARLALYMSLFPQLLAGPIDRYPTIARDMENRNSELSDIVAGFERFFIGLGKKVLIANVLSISVDQIFALSRSDLTTPLAWIGISFYTLQIYFDFSGYTDMAIGLGRVFGFHFGENFNAPYLSRSVQEFWRRWHISLSTWFRDYLYIPLGGNRKGLWRTLLYLVIVFVLCGLWHGANWTFVVWGLFHGMFLMAEHLGWSKRLARLPAWCTHAYLIAVVMVGWVFFRADTIETAFSYLAAMFGLAGGDGIGYYAALVVDGRAMAAFFAGILCMLLERTAMDFWRTTRRSLDLQVGASPSRGQFIFDSFRWFGVAFVMLLSIMELAAGAYNPFIYSRF